MKLSIRKYFSKILTRNFDHYEGFSQNYQGPCPFTAVSSICNQRSLRRSTNKHLWNALTTVTRAGSIVGEFILGTNYGLIKCSVEIFLLLG